MGTLVIFNAVLIKQMEVEVCESDLTGCQKVTSSPRLSMSSAAVGATCPCQSLSLGDHSEHAGRGPSTV